MTNNNQKAIDSLLPEGSCLGDPSGLLEDENKGSQANTENNPSRYATIIGTTSYLIHCTFHFPAHFRKTFGGLDPDSAIEDQGQKIGKYDFIRRAEGKKHQNWPLLFMNPLPPEGVRVKTAEQVWQDLKNSYARTAIRLVKAALPTYLALNAAVGYSPTEKGYKLRTASLGEFLRDSKEI